jgi:type IV pilus assembly protein PilZ
VEVRVDYKTLNGFFADYARNFSRAWTFIRTDKPFEVGTELEYLLSAPGLSLVIRGNVEEQRADGMRVGFYYRTPEERRDNERLIRRRMLEELGPELSARLLG